MRQSRVAAVSRLLWKGDKRNCGHMVKRHPIKEVKVSIESINFKPPTGDVHKSIKQSGAWRYPNGIIQRAPSKELGSNGIEYTDDRDRGENRRKHESNFFITLNTNRYVGELLDGRAAQHAKDAMKQALDELSQEDKMCKYIKFGPKSDHYRDDIFQDVVFKAEWQGAVEVGENLERLHCHIWLTLHHYSQLQVNMPVMQKMFKEAYNSRITMFHKELRANKRPYISVKLLPSSDWAMVMKQYIHKAMAFST